MTTSALYRRHRFPREIIAHAVWLYARFPLSLRMVEELLLERGIDVSYETVRRWGAKFGPALARELRPPGAEAGRRVAPRRGPGGNPRPGPLALAGRGPARRRAR
jgi:putative transposase